MRETKTTSRNARLERDIADYLRGDDHRNPGRGRDYHDQRDRSDASGTLDHHDRVVHQAPTYRQAYAAHERDHHITTSGRRSLPTRLFALPPGPSEVRRGISGRVPFDTIGRARSGLARLGMMRHRGTISARDLERARRRILAHWPSIGRE